MIKVDIQKYDSPKWFDGHHSVHNFKELNELANNYPEHMFKIKYKLEGQKQDNPSKVYQDSGYVGFVVKCKPVHGYTFYEYFSSYAKAEEYVESIKKHNHKMIILKYVTKKYNKAIMVVKNNQTEIVWEPVAFYTNTDKLKTLDMKQWYHIETIVSTFSYNGLFPVAKGCLQLMNLGMFKSVYESVIKSGQLMGYYTYMPF